MAANLKRTTSAINNTRTLIHTAVEGVQTILIGGFVSNKDATEAYRGVTIEIQKLDGTYVVLIKDAVVAVGGSLVIPKLVMDPWDKLYMTADVSGVLETHISYVEKT